MAFGDGAFSAKMNKDFFDRDKDLNWDSDFKGVRLDMGVTIAEADVAGYNL